MKCLLPLFCLVVACAHSNRTPSSTAAPEPLPSVAPSPAGRLRLQEALQMEPSALVAALKAQSPAEPYACGNASAAANCLPLDVREELRGPGKSVADYDRTVQRYLRKYKNKKFAFRERRASELMTDFKCENASESYALAWILERDFPMNEAVDLARNLHAKVSTCQVGFRQDSLIRQGVLALMMNQCPQALAAFDQARVVDNVNSRERLRYLSAKCQKDPTVAVSPVGYPWGAYFLGTGPQPTWSLADSKIWALSVRSGDQEWDRYFATLLQAFADHDQTRFQVLLRDLNAESLKPLPREFQAALLTVLHAAKSDLQVFQVLHPLLQAHPEYASRDLLELLFPRRHWEVIQEQAGPLDPSLVRSLVRQESAFNENARSRVGATGLMQLIYPTARRFGVRRKSELMDPEANVRAGSLYLNDLIQEFNGATELALASYNAGPRLVREWQKRYPTADMDLFVELIPYKETREYVRLVLRNYRVYRLLQSTTPAPSSPQQENQPLARLTTAQSMFFVE